MSKAKGLKNKLNISNTLGTLPLIKKEKEN